MSNKRSKPAKGQKLYMTQRGWRGSGVTGYEVEVVKVGRKYFTVRTCGEEYPKEFQFVIETWNEWRGKDPIGSSRVVLYLEQSEHRERMERRAWLSLFRRVFDRGPASFTLEQLREVGSVLGLNLESDE